MKYSKIQSIEFKRATRGIVCEVAFTVLTHRQYTVEFHSVRGGAMYSRFGIIITILLALIDVLKKRSKLVNELMAIPGDFNWCGEYE